MLATLTHRGPDDSGTWAHGSVALGHCRLSILDETQRAHQPMLTREGDAVLIYNGEVYNYRELRRQLASEGVAFASTGDTEVVLMALYHWGPQRAIPAFDGMFALAYFDRRETTLWLARDRLGIKPLVVADTGNALIFASEVKALLAHPGMRPEINGVGLAGWMVRPHQSAHRMLLKGINGPDSGAWWKVSAGRIEKRSYFTIADAIDDDRLRACRQTKPSMLVDKAEGLLRRSVELHLASDAPLATMCSGGVDSSLITALAREGRPDLTAYVADLPFPDSEGEQAERVARHLGVEIRRIAIERQHFLRLWPLAVWHADGPLLHRSAPALLAVVQAARADGIKVMLTGEGSDELFGGYGLYRLTHRRWAQLEWPRALLMRSSRRRKIERELAAAPFARRGIGDLRSSLGAIHDLEAELLQDLFMKRLGAVVPASGRALMAHCLFDVCENLPMLLHRHDRMGMAASIEMRVPFLENDLMDFAFHLPRKAKLRGRNSKWIVKKAAERFLPADVVYARKKAFPTPGSFVRGTERLLLDGRLADQMQWTRRTTEQVLAALTGHDLLCFHLVGIEMWLHIVLDDERPEDLGERLVSLAA
jgi:asparagine synthase (glutamine-hydrolysing)